MSDAAHGWYGGYAMIAVKYKGFDCYISKPEEHWTLRIGAVTYGPYSSVKKAKAAIRKVI